jgi:hypothetical protein
LAYGHHRFGGFAVGFLRTDHTNLHGVRHQKTGNYNTPFSPSYSADYNYLNYKFSFVAVI